MKITIKAENVDFGGSVYAAVVTTTEMLTLDNIPDMKDAERLSRFNTTESWAYISWKDDYDAERWEEGEGEEGEPKGLGVVFHNSYGSDETMVYASFFALNKALADVVESGEYLEIINHSKDETSVTFSYKLDSKVFKDM